MSTLYNDSVAFDIDSFYYNIINDVYNHGTEVNGTKEINNYRATLYNINQNVINIRGLSKRYMAAELLWYLTGRNDVEFISKYASLWGRISDDGKTNNSAYGYILQRKHGFNQIEKMIELLKADPHSRRAVMNINVPNENVIETKDEMCTICLQFMIRDNKLNCTAVMRSNDCITGTVYDVTYFTLLQKYIADALGIDYGEYVHIAISMHLYERHYKKASEIIEKYDDNSKDDQPFTIDHHRLFTFYEDIMRDVEINDVNPEDAFFNYGVFVSL